MDPTAFDFLVKVRFKYVEVKYHMYWLYSINTSYEDHIRWTRFHHGTITGAGITYKKIPWLWRARLAKNKQKKKKYFSLPDHQLTENLIFIFFFYQGFLHRHWRFTGQQGKGGDYLLFPLYHFHPLTNIETFATLHVRWLSRIFNRNACVYQTATQWGLPPYLITIWVIDWWCNVCLFTWFIKTRFLLQRFDIGKRWIWTRINNHPCITSEPTNQVC